MKRQSAEMITENRPTDSSETDLKVVNLDQGNSAKVQSVASQFE